MANWTSPKEGYVPSYQISAKPFATGSISVTHTAAKEIKFPFVTRWVQVTNTGTGDLRVGFSENGVNANPAANSNYFLLETAAAAASPASSVRLELRCKSLFVRGDSASSTVSVVAGLTDILDLTSKLSGSEGVG